MSNHKVPRLSDRDIAAKLAAIQRDIAQGDMLPINFTALDQSIAGVSFPEQQSDPWQRLLEADGASIEQFSANVGNGVGLHYYRGGQADPKSPYFDEIRISLPNGTAECISVGARILALFRPTPLSPATSAADESVLAVRAIQESMLERLQRMHEDGIRRAAEHSDAVERRYREKANQLEVESKAATEATQAKLEKERERVAADAAELERQRKALDDRSNTHARRDIRDRMLADIKGRISAFGVSAPTEAKRKPVRNGIFALAALLLAALVQTSFELLNLKDAFNAVAILEAARASASSAPQPQSVDSAAAWSPSAWLLWGRIVLLSFGLVATLLYYIRWQNKWAEQHSQSEFGLQQFYIDVNRANWVLESCLEWRKETDSPIPSVLLDSITRGLFTPAEGQPENAMHPSDELASAILGTASKLKLKAGDSELEFDKPGKALKAAEKR